MGIWTYTGYKPTIKSMCVIGDSISTFAGYSVDTSVSKKPDYYPTGDVIDVEDTWWNKLAKDLNAILISNNSRSGSTICYDGFNDGLEDNKGTSFIDRMKALGKAELYIIEGATNDSSFTASMGEYKYADWVDSDFQTFRPACCYLLDYLSRQNPGARVIFLLNNGLSSAINESVETICEHYDVPLLKLSNITKADGHPTKAGMQQIVSQLEAFLVEERI